MEKKIADEFGNKIGGSKRDLWKQRGLTVQDTEDMNDAEKATFIKKDNIWKKPDYQSLKEEGIPVVVIYFRKVVRDGVAVKPNTSKDYDTYISVVEKIRDKVNNLRTEKEADQLFYWFEKEGLIKEVGNRRYSLSNEMYIVGGSNLFNKIRKSTTSYLRDVKKKQFLYSEDEKILSKYQFNVKTGEKAEPLPSWSSSSKVKGCGIRSSFGWQYMEGCSVEEFEKIPYGAVYVMKGHTYIATFTDIETAKNEVLETEKALISSSASTKAKKERKKKFVPVQLAHIEMTGADYRKEKDVTGQDYLDTFGFYGGEFGNYLSDKDRQASLNMGYDSFMNLAEALDINANQISMGGKLSIAFGARGSGNAMAHYEPLRKVINLTKMRGAGSLAHEYGHAMDFILGEVKGGHGFSSSYRISYKPFLDVVNAMQRYNGSISKFYKDAKALDTTFAKDSKGYWHSTTEMFARAFACYISDKLSEKGIRDDYLCGHAESATSIDSNGNTVYAYPIGEEREQINKAIDALICSLKKDNLL